MAWARSLKRNCFLGHDWENWETKELYVNYEGTEYISGLAQTRSCRRCNFRKMRHVF